MVGYKEKYHHRKEDGKTSHWCVSCSAGPEHKDPPLKGFTVPSSDNREHSSHCFQHLLPSLQGTAVFILKGQGLHDHQLTGSACDFQNAILYSK